MRDIEIMECTLRDGSYPIAYQFTLEDTALIAAGLEAAGFQMIEVGHGLGLGASTPKIGVAAALDEEYLEAASSALQTAKFGAFFIPGIADERHLQLAAKYGMGFVRIGTNVTETQMAERYIKDAKQKGMIVSANLMKTYALPIADVVRRAEDLEKWGVDVVAVVDSAGGMLPEEVRVAVKALRSSLGVRIGFHGHNNLQLAVSNSLTALDAGATIVDATLRGLGRSSGNAQTEVLVMILEKMGRNPGIDIYKTLDLAERLIAPMSRGRGVDALEATAGYALFHSSFMPLIHKYARNLGLDPRQLMIRVSEIDKVSVTDDLVRSVAEKLKSEQDMEKGSVGQLDVTRKLAGASSGMAGVPAIEAAAKVAREMKSIAAKSGRRTVFTLAMSIRPDSPGPRFPFIRSSQNFVIGNAEVTEPAQGAEIAEAIDGLVDVVLVDVSQDPHRTAALFDMVRKTVRKSELLTYRDVDGLLRATDGLLAHLCCDAREPKVVICGMQPHGWKLALLLATRGYRVTVLDEKRDASAEVLHLNSLIRQDADHEVRWTSSWKEAAKDCDVLVGARPDHSCVHEELVAAIPGDARIIDMVVGSISPAALEKAAVRGIAVHRVDMRAGLAAEVVHSYETMQLMRNVVGRCLFHGIPIVAGGVIGNLGDLVVDAVPHPSGFIGVADGGGGLLPEEESGPYRNMIVELKKAIMDLRLSAVPLTE